MRKEDRYHRFLGHFSQELPVAETELDYLTTYELIVAVILSAQCTDKRVNLITPAFFERFPDVFSLADATEDDVFQLIRTCSYPNNKSRHLVGMARAVCNRFGGNIPATLEELSTLPGVGRKTANVILAVAFNKPAMPVDTHVFRVSARIGLTTNAKTPLETEKQLVKHIPGDKLPLAHHWLILHGRYVCTARKPKCTACRLSGFCKYFEKNVRKQV